MRVIEAFEEAVLKLAVSPDGRFLAAATSRELAVCDWVSGRVLHRHAAESDTGRLFVPEMGQVAFGPDSSWVARLYQRAGGSLIDSRVGRVVHALPGSFSGGVAVSPDGKTLAATRSGRVAQVKLECWELPGLRPKTGFDFWSPFTKLAFSPNGEFIAGIGTNLFELRVAVSGGLNGQRRVRYVGDGFFGFSRDSQTVVFGWESALHVMDTRNGNVTRQVTYLELEMLRDLAFLGTGRHFATVDGTPVVRVWSADSWAIEREYDWGCGGLTSVTASADGLAGVCGTRTGKVVVFDVDE
ncbi:WD40 repeat domain-containing protein [Gemmata sp.]|uniref:WD40 repeat domain-containing protein n=1 Tax=Gemmata sp. TaxID=1914242 RepID=UPI003F70EA1D